MKKQFLLCSTVMLFFLSCDPGKKKDNSNPNNVPIQLPTTTNSQFIPLDSANKMINSYVGSLSATNLLSDTSLKSVSFDAAQLRAYLADTSITSIKISFAHTLGYVNSGNVNLDARYRSTALTLILSGYDLLGNFIYHGNQVLDFAVNCPTNCPPGQAASATFPIKATTE